MNEEDEADQSIKAPYAGERVSRDESAVGRPDVVVFYGDAEQVATGFALALEAMQVQADLQRSDGKRGGTSK